jgi:hypothetical protein
MDILKTIQQNDMLKVALILLAVYFFMKYYNKESLDNVEAEPVVQAPVVQAPVVQVAQAPAPVETEAQQSLDKMVSGSNQLSTVDLLPVYDDANEFAKQNPVSQLLKDQNYLQAGYHMGINTIVQSNKIPYLDLRSAPPIAKGEAGPWNQSSYETPAGANRRFMEIGQ